MITAGEHEDQKKYTVKSSAETARLRDAAVVRHLRLRFLLSTFFAIFNAILLLYAVVVVLSPFLVLHGNMNSVLQPLVERVNRTIGYTEIDFEGPVEKQVISRLIRPVIRQIFIHVTLIITNQAIVLIAMLTSTKFLFIFSMGFTVFMTFYDVGMFIYISTIGKTADHEFSVKALRYLQRRLELAIAKLFFNHYQRELECCGVFTQTEYLSGFFRWDNSIIVNGTTYKLQYPVTCCPGYTLGQVPRCALECTTDEPHLKGCSEKVAETPLFKVTTITENLYTVPFFIAHVISLCLWWAKQLVQWRFRKSAYANELILIDDDLLDD